MPDDPHTPNTALVAIDFHGDQILTCQKSGEPIVLMRRLVDNLGLNWAGQHAKLVTQFDKFACMDIHTHDTLGRPAVMLAMPVAKLALWLATINPNKIPDPAKRAKIELYQSESAIVLHDYWTKGFAIRGDMDGVVSAVDPQVMKALGGMMKAIMNKQLVSIVDQLVSERLLSDRLKLVAGVCSLQVAEIAGFGRGNRPRGLIQFITSKLSPYHRDRKHLAEKSQYGSGKVLIWNEAVARQWLDEGGRAAIQNYVAQRKGQGRLRLVKP